MNGKRLEYTVPRAIGTQRATGVMTTACRYTEINATRETRSARGAPPQPGAREGQAGPARVTERPVVPSKPGNSGGGKGPQFKADARRNRQPGDWHEPNTSTEGREVADGVAHQSEGLAWLPVLRP